MRKVILVLAAAVLISGCATVTMSQATAPNRENMLKVSIGMTKEQVLNIMGTRSITAGGFNLAGPSGAGPNITITNPYRSEILQGKDKAFEVLYYVTDDKTGNGVVTDDCLTPFVFDGGKLIGWGQSFLNDNIQKYEIRVR